MRARGARRHRRRGARGRGRRRCDAADDRSDQSRAYRPKCRSWWRSPRSTAKTPTPIVCASSWWSRSWSPRSGAATPSSTRWRHRPASASTSCSSAILLVADVEELAANPKAPARAFVLESNLDPGRGPVVTALVERGTLRVGEPIVAGGGWGRVRAMFDDHGPAGHRGRPVDAGRDPRPRRRAARGRRAAGRARRQDRPHRGRGPVVAAAQGEPRAPDGPGRRCPPRGHLRDGPAGRGRHAQPRAQGRRARLARSGHRRAAQARPGARGSAAVVRAPRRRRDHRVRREPRRGVERHRDRLQRATRPQGPRARRDREGGAPPLRGHLPGARGRATARSSACSSPSSRKWSPARPRSARSSACPGSARSPVATCSTARSPVARACASCATAWSSGTARSRRSSGSRTTSREVQSGFECGIGLSDFQDLKPGDIIETYELKEIPRG